MSGVAHITLPGAQDQGLWVIGGANGLIVAADTTGEGHITTYPSDRETLAFAIPFANGSAPAYDVVNKGECESAVVPESMSFVLSSRDSMINN